MHIHARIHIYIYIHKSGALVWDDAPSECAGEALYAKPGGIMPL